MSAEPGLPVASGRSVLREVWRGLDRRWGRLAGLAAVFIAAAAAGVLPPLAIGLIVDAVTAGEGSSTVWLAGTAMAGAVVVSAVLTAVGVITASRILETMLAVMREDMVSSALRLPQARVERAGTGALVSRAGDDVSQVAEAIPAVVPAVTGSLFTIAVTFAALAVIDVRYALALLIIVPVHAYAVRRYLADAPQLYAAEREAMAVRAQHLLDSLRGIETVHAFDLAGHHLSRIGAASWAVVRWTMHTRAVQNAFFARLNFAEFAGMTALLVVGFLIVQGGTGTIGGATAAMLLFLRLFDPINQLLFVVDQLQSALASLARISGVIGDDQGGTTAASETPAPTAGLRLRGIGHAYTSGHAVLAEIDVAVAPGETVAVVGATGAGKSTLAAIAAGVQSPTCGRVDMPAGTVLVTQEVHVFSTTLRDNLTLAKADASDAELRSALDAVGLALVPDRLPDGLDTRLHPDTLTAAEVQQLALARVLLVDPPAVILDEATAESGSSDASRLEEAAKRVIAGRTALVVAHRLNQAEAADRVIVMSSGRTIEEGTHTELLAANGSYARLWEAWRNHRD